MQVKSVKTAFYTTDPEVSVSDALPPKMCPSATVVLVHDGALAEEHAVTSTFNSVLVEIW